MLNPETITVIDPACGSGHILVEAYDVLKAIYLERGYQLRSIPRLILEKNLYGLDIDDRAAQLAGFALLMKARADDRRLFDELPKINVYSLQSSKNLNLPLLWRQLDLNGQSNIGVTSSLFDEPQTDLIQVIDDSNYQLIKNTLALFQQAQTLGSLIQVPVEHTEPLKDLLAQLQALTTEGDNFQTIAATTLIPFIRQAVILGMQFDAVVANPPYMGNKYLTPLLKSYLKENYKGFEKDLFSAFMIRGLSLTNESGQLGFMSPFVWMFISSHQELRMHFIDNATLSSLIQLEYSGFDGATVPICTFTLGKAHVPNYTGSYIKLSDFKGHENQAPKTLEAIKNPNCGWFYTAKPDNFKKISGSPVAYWVSEKFRGIFTNNPSIDEKSPPKTGISTGKNGKYILRWHEVDTQLFGINQTKRSQYKYYPHNKGGDFRKWYGNQTDVLKYSDIDIAEMQLEEGFRHDNAKLYFLPSLSWTKITSGNFNARWYPEGFTLNSASVAIYPENPDLMLGYLNSVAFSHLTKAVSQTLNFTVGEIAKLPVLNFSSDVQSGLVIRLIEISKTDWNNYETSWDFTALPLIRQKKTTLKAAFEPVGWMSDSVTQQTEATDVGLRDKAANPTYASTNLEQCFNRWQTQNRAAIVEMKRLEEENNRLFIEAYGLQNELSPEVPEAQITLARADREKDSQRLISYAIGCMMGRYSLDEPGLIYAHAGNVGFEPNRYNTFLADVDGIVPITGELWFEDDAANRLNEFLLAIWDAETLEENRAWLATSLSQKGNETSQETIRRYIAGSFYKNHLQTYKKRPIYWLFSSGKQGAFQALVYLHRYNESTLSRMRAEYVVPLTGKIQSRIDMLEKDAAVASSNAERSKLGKDIEKLRKKYVELLSFDEKLRHYADLRIQLDWMTA